MADTEKNKIPFRSIVTGLIVLLVWVGGYFLLSHFTGSMRLDSDADVAAALAQANQTEAVTVLETAEADGLRAVLFDPGTPGDRSDDGLALFVPDPVFRSRWCYADAVPQDAAAPLTLYTSVSKKGDPAHGASALCVIFGTEVPDSVTGCTLCFDGQPSGEPIAVQGPSVLALAHRDATEDRFTIEIS